MKLSEFDYNLPPKFIAQKPVFPRDRSRLMIINRQSGEIRHSHFYKIGDFLKKGDVVVLNNSKVFPARLLGRKLPTGGKVEIFLVHPRTKACALARGRPCTKNQREIIWDNQWKIIGRPKLKIGQEIQFSAGLTGKILAGEGKEKIIEFNKKGENLRMLIFRFGKTPTPPYIKSKIPEAELKKYYQTVYAKHLGSIAAPTAGFHFTKQLIRGLKKKGVILKFTTLHVGIGTFQPIDTETIEDYKMPAEWAGIDQKIINELNNAKRHGQRIISVGTTATRTLEGFSRNEKIIKSEGLINLFIFPGYKFKFIGGLITNFHLPKSTPLLLTAAFAGKNLIFKAYKEAIKRKYRFYSFGDAMMIV